MKTKFTRLKLKMLLQIVLYSILAVIMGIILLFLIDGILQEPFADTFVSFLQSLGFSEERGIELYQILIRNHKSEILLIGLIVLLLLFSYLALSKFAKYLNQISKAVETVFQESEGIVSLPSELKPLEIQLNTIKDTLKQRKVQAKESEQQKNDLVVYLAHDLKTPLTSVIGYLNLLHDAQEISPQLQEKYLDITIQKAQRLEELINEFFDITRINLQDMDLKHNKLNLSMMLQQVADEFYPLFESKHLTLRTQIQPGVIIYGDGDKLARVFDNLLKNAINYSYQDSEIFISLVQRAQEVELIFSNQGDQIPETSLNNIFDKFYRVDNARPSSTGGAGLGLAIAKRIVEQHGGRITAKSNQECTSFIVLIPTGIQ